jgi:hypothetical protein
MNTLPIVLGPTASAKSELAIHIALAMGGEIVNCDSMQIYRGFRWAGFVGSYKKGTTPANLSTRPMQPETCRCGLMYLLARPP